MTVQVEALTYEALKAKCDHLEQICAQTLQVKLTMAETIKELTDRVNALAVENAALADALSLISHCYKHSPHIQSMCVVETPATDAALAAIEAQGVEKFAAWASEQESMASDSSDKKEARIYCQVAARAKHFAKQLREAK